MTQLTIEDEFLRIRAEQRDALREMVRQAEELGLYELSFDELYCKTHERHEPCRRCMYGDEGQHNRRVVRSFRRGDRTQRVWLEDRPVRDAEPPGSDANGSDQ